MNDLFYILQNDLHNFADDNTISAFSQIISDLIYSLTDKSNSAINWLHWNSIIVNPDKFKAEYQSVSEITVLPQRNQSACWVYN